MKETFKTVLPNVAFLLLFASEFTYYLLILQTGIVEYHHSLLSQIWMVPLGGMLGIILSVYIYKKQQWLMALLLFLQLLLSFSYASANGLELFALGLISGLTAPMLLYRIEQLWIAVCALALSYAFGTALFHVEAIARTDLALFLSALAFISALFTQTRQHKSISVETVSLYTMGSVFLWLLLDAALFETLSRDSVMHLWGESEFTLTIILSHMAGLAAAYRLRNWAYADMALLVLFVLVYSVYSSGSSLMLSLVYPFVISSYNVIILMKLKRLAYLPLAAISLSLWGASGLGLLIALSHTFAAAWAVLGVLALSTLFKMPGFNLLSWFPNLKSTSFKG
ncbi:hypothetical protein [Sulfurovum riftiae]|uniref:Uncharacterized protein n=1 Tax=Sulfurovum riftiae TaxID=1630136 RepID=A0A151CEE6_9BACT|nr:hypothetical protein [Sulfurovum riftiae]KYJ85844.1 hypothetical protein AS592_04435 [Sulfurovum riftiae]